MKTKRTVPLRVESAEANVAAARADVRATLGQIRWRIDPRVIIAEAAERNLARVSNLIDGAQTKVKARPWLIVGGATLFGIGMVARARLRTENSEPDETERSANC